MQSCARAVHIAITVKRMAESIVRIILAGLKSWFAVNIGTFRNEQYGMGSELIKRQSKRLGPQHG